ncbi:hypothetical protein VF21_00070 [Pseudogymnoascus sp. 05NY08]|nr:hypothetical protein VF21_00225 [Pseudogymnoascus sp. 05NY08]OBT80957.1 hypothetical protein VF21_00070 [Pseudogymnoascus sp. 05NY08]
MVDEPRLGKTLDETQDVEKVPLGIVSEADHNGECGAVDNGEKAEKSADGLSIPPPATSSISAERAEETKKHARSKSQSASVRSRAVTIIPRSKRKGLLGRLALIPEVTNPKEYARKTKWLITFIVALAAAAAPMGSAILFPTLPQLSAELNASSTVTNLSVALYMLAMSIFPLWWSSFSETLGRRTIYLVSFTLFTLFAILSAISTSISMLIVMRVLSGGAAASVQAVGAGTIADMWEQKERGKAMGIFYLGPLMGPLFAPIIGGALGQRFGWRSSQWFLAIYGGCLIVVLTFCLPETLRKTVPISELASGNPGTSEDAVMPVASRVTTRLSVKDQTVTVARVLKRCFIDPLMIVTYLRFPAVALTVYYAAITFGCLYILNISVQETFSSPPYDFSIMIIGLMYIPNSLGYVCAALFGGRWSDIIMAREAKAAGRYDTEGRLILLPEDRMRENAFIAAAMYPLALVLYGWIVCYGKHWIIAAIANFFFGVGSMIIFSCATTMLTEFMPKKSSSGVALNNFVRNIFSCVGGIVASPLIDTIGNGWLFTGLGVWALASGSVVWAMRRFGPKWRDEMVKIQG